MTIVVITRAREAVVDNILKTLPSIPADMYTNMVHIWVLFIRLVLSNYSLMITFAHLFQGFDVRRDIQSVCNLAFGFYQFLIGIRYLGQYS